MCLAIVPVIALLASALYVEGAQVPITSYVCTQPSQNTFSDANQCSVTSGLRTCETEEGVCPDLLNGDPTEANGKYVWNGNTNPFVVLDIPQGWCVGSVQMTFIDTDDVGISTPSLSVHSAERLSNNTSRTMFSFSARHNEIKGHTQIVMNLTILACGRYLRINMTSGRDLDLTEIEVFGTSFSTFMPSTATASPTLSGSSASSTIPGTSPTPSPSPSITPSDVLVVQDNYVQPAASAGPEVQPSPRDPPIHNASSIDMGSSIGISSGVLFAGLLAGVALAGPAGALSVACYHWKKKRLGAKTRRKDTKVSEDKEVVYDCPLQLEENPAYEAMQK